MSGGDLNRFVDARALDDVEATHLFFGFGERAIGYQHLAVADADGAGIAAWPEPRATAPGPPGVHLPIPRRDLRQGRRPPRGPRSPIRHRRSFACASLSRWYLAGGNRHGL